MKTFLKRICIGYLENWWLPPILVVLWVCLFLFGPAFFMDGPVQADAIPDEFVFIVIGGVLLLLAGCLASWVWYPLYKQQRQKKGGSK